MKLIDKLKHFLGIDILEEEQADVLLSDVQPWKRIAQEKHEEAILYQKKYNEVMLENHRLRKTVQTLEDMRKLGIGGF